METWTDTCNTVIKEFVLRPAERWEVAQHQPSAAELGQQRSPDPGQAQVRLQLHHMGRRCHWGTRSGGTGGGNVKEAKAENGGSVLPRVEPLQHIRTEGSGA